MQTIEAWCAQDKLLQPTRWRVVDVHDPVAVQDAVSWWLESTERGGEGMVVKPRRHVVRDAESRLVQPGVKCRGREYLRIIYGPAYTEPENLARLRHRGVGRKRGLAVREFVLGGRGPGALRPAGAAATRPRVRAGGARPGVGAGGSTVVAGARSA